MSQTIRGLTPTGTVTGSMALPTAPTSGEDTKTSINQLTTYMQNNLSFASLSANQIFSGNNTFTGRTKENDTIIEGYQVNNLAVGTPVIPGVISAAIMTGGIVPLLPSGDGFTMTFDSAANIIAALPAGLSDGDSIKMRLINTSNSYGVQLAVGANSLANGMPSLFLSPRQEMNIIIWIASVSSPLIIYYGGSWVNAQGIKAFSASRTLQFSDYGNTLNYIVGTDATLQIPTNGSVNFPVGAIIPVVQQGGGQVLFSPAGGVTLQSVVGSTIYSNGIGSRVFLTYLGSDVWNVSGDITNLSRFLVSNIDISTVAEIWSVYHVNKLYGGYTWLVKRSSDNATTNVAFDPDLHYVTDNSPVSSGGTYGLWKGTDDVILLQWFGQVNNNTAVAPIGQEPIVAIGGVTVTGETGLPGILFPATANQYLSVAASATINLVDQFTFNGVFSADDQGATSLTVFDKRDAGDPHFKGYAFSWFENGFGIDLNTDTITSQFFNINNFYNSVVSNQVLNCATGSIILSGTLESVVYKGLTPKYYSNTSITGNFTNSAPLKIGADYTGAIFQGIISELAIYNTFYTNATSIFPAIRSPMERFKIAG